MVRVCCRRRVRRFDHLARGAERRVGYADPFWCGAGPIKHVYSKPACGEPGMNARQASPATEYKEFPAPAHLADRFLCFWTQTVAGSQGAYEQRVLPDACIDIVLVHGRPPMVIGPWDVPFVAQLAVGTSITGARLHPGRASCLLGLPASELLNQRRLPLRISTGALQSARLEGVD